MFGKQVVQLQHFQEQLYSRHLKKLQQDYRTQTQPVNEFFKQHLEQLICQAEEQFAAAAEPSSGAPCPIMKPRLIILGYQETKGRRAWHQGADRTELVPAQSELTVLVEEH